ncbi:HD domain-containing protein [Tenggerimyces flavus]|uniref:Metal-dependent phosphohydrolase n=1 Tax=Tenggerimyces flavus TaxID=1708749 RepID=A0ABV7Y7L5_9ACTN|nr:metal-dependent phosphohydrolase [Tenggerimyces flavus]MBM7785213.1 putative metal-dependent HD superfamily phosphohydrolase [Tenggerimyces flavus]
MTELWTTLFSRWTRLLPGADDVGRDLLERYGEAHRRYHDTEHLAEVLVAIDVLHRHASDPDAVRIAAWFHDAVYDPQRKDNEEESAHLAESVLPGAGVAESRISRVAALVRLTTTHDPAASDVDGAVLSDADLAVLASEPERYARYASDVRAEYAFVPEDAFRHGRLNVLEDLLSHGALFRTPTGHALWEERARRNLTTEVALLRMA